LDKITGRGLGGAGDSLSEVAYNAIRHRLVTLTIPPGETFSEGQLAGELMISKTPVREALARLQQEGLVDVEPRAGYRATPITVGDARDLLSVRILLEGEAAALAAARIGAGQVDPSVVREVEELSKVTYDPESRASIWRHLETNTAFHVGIARIGGNRYLTEALARVFVLCERLLHAGMALTTRPRDVLNEHREIIRAVFSGDPDVARSVAMEQAARGRELILDALLSSASVMTAWIEIPEAAATETGRKSELVSAR
jgi:DNA-binding GntR family transcriptional regulator